MARKPPGQPLSYFDADPNVVLANAQQAQGLQHLNAWLRAGQQRANLDAQVGTDRLNRAWDTARQSILANLAARGLGRSGDVGYQQGQAALDFADKRYNFDSGILDRLTALNKSYLQGAQNIRNATSNAYLKSFGQAGANPTTYVAPGYTPAPQAAPPQPKPVAAPYQSSVPWANR